MGSLRTNGHIETRVRTAMPSDADAVSALLAASYAQLLPSCYSPEILDITLPLITQANSALLASGTYYLAETAAGQILGCGGWTSNPPEADAVLTDEAHIRHFATHPNSLRRGIGASILGRCLDAAEQSGVRRLHCYSSLNGECFYRSAGFISKGVINIPMRPGISFPAMMMIKDFSCAQSVSAA
jgi:N-acetylglutamate synthase-like GNAT family acetyltransferase